MRTLVNKNVSSLALVFLFSVTANADNAKHYKELIKKQNTTIRTTNTDIAKLKKKLAELNNRKRSDTSFGDYYAIGNCFTCDPRLSCSEKELEKIFCRKKAGESNPCEKGLSEVIEATELPCIAFYNQAVTQMALQGDCLATLKTCPKIARLEAVKEIEAEIEDKQAIIVEAEAQKESFEEEMQDVIGCVDCQQRKPSTGELIIGGLQAVTPALVAGINGYYYAKGVEQFANSYSNYIDQCATIGIPCIPPGGYGGGYYGGYGSLGISGLGGSSIYMPGYSGGMSGLFGGINGGFGPGFSSWPGMGGMYSGMGGMYPGMGGMGGMYPGMGGMGGMYPGMGGTGGMGGMGSGNLQYLMMMQAQIQNQVMYYQRVQQVQQDMMVAQQQMMEAQMRYQQAMMGMGGGMSGGGLYGSYAGMDGFMGGYGSGRTY